MSLSMPFVRYAAKTAYLLENQKVAARDCHILYIISGSGSFSTENGDFPLKADTLVYFPHGIPYKLVTHRKMLFYTVNFDFDRSFSKLPPMTPEEYREGKEPDLVGSIPDDFDGIFSKIKVIDNAVWAKRYLIPISEKSAEKCEFKEEIQGANLLLFLYDFCECEKKTDNSLCTKIKELVSNDVSLNNARLGKELGYHPYYLNELFKENEGISLHKYIVKARLGRAYALISTTETSLNGIAADCGFCSLAHFSSAFASYYGFPPSNLRKKT